MRWSSQFGCKSVPDNTIAHHRFVNASAVPALPQLLCQGGVLLGPERVSSVTATSSAEGRPNVSLVHPCPVKFERPILA